MAPFIGGPCVFFREQHVSSCELIGNCRCWPSAWLDKLMSNGERCSRDNHQCLTHRRRPQFCGTSALFQVDSSLINDQRISSSASKDLRTALVSESVGKANYDGFDWCCFQIWIYWYPQTWFEAVGLRWPFQHPSSFMRPRPIDDAIGFCIKKKAPPWYTPKSQKIDMIPSFLAMIWPYISRQMISPKNILCVHCSRDLWIRKSHSSCLSESWKMRKK